MASEIRVNQIQNRSGLTTTTFTDTGVTIAGILTVSKNLNVGGVVTYEDVTNIDSVGIITARTGINLVGNDLNVGSNIKLGNASGIVTATSFSGSGANLTSLPAQATIANNADNRIITGGSGVNLNGEANLTWNGTAMAVGHSNPNDTLHVYHATDNLVARFESGDTGGGITLKDNTHVTSLLTTNGAFEINVDQGGDISGETIAFKLSGSEKVRIDSSGRMGIGDNSPDRELVVKNASSNAGVKIEASNAHTSQLFFSDTDAENVARISVFHGSGQATSNAMIFDTAGTTRMMITSGGDVLIGRTSTSTSHTLCVQADNNAEAIVICGRSADDIGELSWYENDSTTRLGEIQYRTNQCNIRNRAPGSYTNFATTPSGGSVTDRLRIQSDGNFVVGNRVGTSAPQTNQPVAFHSARVTPHTASSTLSNGVRCNLYVGSNTGWAVNDGGCIGMGGSRAGYASQEAMWGYIKGSRSSGNGWEYAGKLELGTAEWGTYNTTKCLTLHADNQIDHDGKDNTMYSGSIGGAVRVRLQHTGGGNMVLSNPSSGSFTFDTSSDYRLKENESAISNALSTVKALKPYQYKWKHDGKLGQGFFAHEAQEVLPDVGIVSGTKDAVHTEDDTEKGHWKKDDPIYQQIDYSKLVPLLTAALQEETAKREALEARVAALES